MDRSLILRARARFEELFIHNHGPTKFVMDEWESYKDDYIQRSWMAFYEGFRAGLED